MKQRNGVSPVLIELLVVVLFFAVCATINLQVLAKANTLSRASESQSAALLAASDICERIRSDPEGFGSFDAQGVCIRQLNDGEMTLHASILRSPMGGGAYYEYTVTALKGGEELVALRGGSYQREGRP